MRISRGQAPLFCAAFSLAGLVLAGYLSFLHLALLRGDLLGGPLCGGAGSFLNCHAVAASRFGKLFGVPVAFWGILGYLILLTLSLVAWRLPEFSRPALTAVAGLAGACLFLDLGLLWVMVVKIRALCLLCIVMYLLKVLLLATGKRGLGQSWHGLFGELPEAWRAFLPRRGSAAGLLLWLVAALGLAGILSVHFTAEFLSRAPDGLRDRVLHRMRAAPRVAVNAGDSPRVGSAGAPVQVVMFTDPLCPLCREAAEFNAIALKAYPGKISIVVKQFPSDPECERLGVTATPTFFVNGVKILGAITPAQFDEIIREEENRAVLVPQGEKP